MSFEILKNRRKHGDRDCFLLSYQVVPKHAQKLMAMWLYTRQVEHRQIAFVSVASWVSGRVWLADPMPQRFPSKAWSCSDLVAGAAAVVDQMEGVPTDLAVVNLKRDLLQQTDGLGVQELQKMLQDK